MRVDVQSGRNAKVQSDCTWLSRSNRYLFRKKIGNRIGFRRLLLRTGGNNLRMSDKCSASQSRNCSPSFPVHRHSQSSIHLNRCPAAPLTC